MNTVGEGKYKTWARKEKIGDDLLIIVGGGEKTHIGSIIICEPSKKTRIIRMGRHKDHIIIKPIAEKASKKYKTKTIGLGGIHIDNASDKEIKKIIDNCERLTECI